MTKVSDCVMSILDPGLQDPSENWAQHLKGAQHLKFWGNVGQWGLR
jgi:hypothetical protein